jgi:hypothetical protein
MKVTFFILHKYAREGATGKTAFLVRGFATLFMNRESITVTEVNPIHNAEHKRCGWGFFIL